MLSTKEEINELEEIEIEKDHTSLIPPLKSYFEKALISVKMYEDDATEFGKIAARVRADANNITSLATRLEAHIVNITTLKAKRDEITKFAFDCLAFLDSAEKSASELK